MDVALEDGLGSIEARWGCRGGLDTLSCCPNGDPTPSVAPIENVDLSNEEAGVGLDPSRGGRGKGAIFEVLGEDGNNCSCDRVDDVKGCTGVLTVCGVDIVVGSWGLDTCQVCQHISRIQNHH